MTKSAPRRRKALSELISESPAPPGRVLGAHEAPPLPYAALGALADSPVAAEIARRVDPAAVADRILRSGWRPMFGWCGVALAAVITTRIALGLDVPGLEYLAAPLGATVVAIVTRTVEKLQGAAG